MKEEFEKLVAAGKLHRQHVEPLLLLTEGGFCFHRSWGFGKINLAATDWVFGRFTIDFQNKAGHTMDMAFAAESLKPIGKDHIYARKDADIGNLREMAAKCPSDLIKLVLQSFSDRATIDQIQQVLAPDVIPDDWKKWWEAAKRALKKDGHFQVPLKKSDPIIYQLKEVSLQSRLLAGFRAAKGLKPASMSPMKSCAIFLIWTTAPGGPGSHSRSEHRDCDPSTHPALRRAGSHFCPR